jgi:hypothetical protein
VKQSKAERFFPLEVIKKPKSLLTGDPTSKNRIDLSQCTLSNVLSLKFFIVTAKQHWGKVNEGCLYCMFSY